MDKPEIRQRNNGVIVGACVAFVASMVGMSYASVPLYRLYCQLTGDQGTTQRVDQASNVILDKTIKVRFDGNVGGGLPWEFAPDNREITVRIGETVKAFYRVKNVSDRATFGQATYNVTPMISGAYFNKIECFCFTETKLEPNEELEMPVVFYVDPEIVKPVETQNLATITLSYTFFPHEKESPVAEVTGAANTDKKKL
jgi:cytochrome c oxidase assembly protein subunit 11